MTTLAYDESQSLRDARTRYFQDNAFGDDGGYAAKWVKLQLGPVPFAIPNSAARVRALKFHDLHHVVTGYATNVVGEAEIGAWEIGSGCAGFVAAWILNLYAMVLGLAGRCARRRVARLPARPPHCAISTGPPTTTRCSTPRSAKCARASDSRRTHRRCRPRPPPIGSPSPSGSAWRSCSRSRRSASPSRRCCSSRARSSRSSALPRRALDRR